MIACLIVDDELSAINVLKSYIDQIPFLTLANSTTDPLEALKIVHQQPIDLIFMDIHMPNMSGIDLMKMVNGNRKIILTTAYSEFAVEGFEHQALDYLLKPISFERFTRAAQRALEVTTAMSARPGPETPDEYMFVKTETKGKMLKINFRDICYIEGLGNYVTIHTADQEKIITYASFKALLQRLPPEFIRIQKSYIVSMRYVRAIDGNQIFLQDRKNPVPLGEAYRSRFFEVLEGKTMGGRS